MQLLCRECGNIGYGNFNTLICFKCEDKLSRNKEITLPPPKHDTVGSSEFNPPLTVTNRKERVGRDG